MPYAQIDPETVPAVFVRQFLWRLVMSNRKLIRTTLADVKARRDEGYQRDRSNGGPQQRSGMPPPRPPQPSSSSSSIQIRKRQPPPTETHAEIYYYKKQI